MAKGDRKYTFELVVTVEAWMGPDDTIPEMQDDAARAAREGLEREAFDVEGIQTQRLRLLEEVK